MIALALAPATVSIITQFFFPMQNPRIDCSAALLSIGIPPSSRNLFKYFPDSGSTGTPHGSFLFALSCLLSHEPTQNKPPLAALRSAGAALSFPVPKVRPALILPCRWPGSVAAPDRQCCFSGWILAMPFVPHQTGVLHGPSSLL